MRGENPAKLIWCLGMYASASTWLFNAAHDVAAVLYPQEQPARHFAESMKELRAIRPGVNLVKSHQLTLASRKYLNAQAGVILISLRDPRDAVTSMMQHMGWSFAKALRQARVSAKIAAQFAGDARAALFIYETGFTETPATFDRLATALGGELTSAQRAALFAATRREKIEEKISRLADLPTVWHSPAGDDLFDRDTHWHRHHAGRSGESGRWRRMLPPQNAALVEDRMADFMRGFGYLGEHTLPNTREGCFITRPGQCCGAARR